MLIQQHCSYWKLKKTSKISKISGGNRMRPVWVCEALHILDVLLCCIATSILKSNLLVIVTNYIPALLKLFSVSSSLWDRTNKPREREREHVANIMVTINPTLIFPKFHNIFFEIIPVWILNSTHIRTRCIHVWLKGQLQLLSYNKVFRFTKFSVWLWRGYTAVRENLRNGQASSLLYTIKETEIINKSIVIVCGTTMFVWLYVRLSFYVCKTCFYFADIFGKWAWVKSSNKAFELT